MSAPSTLRFVLHLSGANLTEASLSGANLSAADLTDATVTQEQLDLCKSLKCATMPDGQILKSDDNPDGPTFQEWLESRGKEGENP